MVILFFFFLFTITLYIVLLHLSLLSNLLLILLMLLLKFRGHLPISSKLLLISLHNLLFTRMMYIQTIITTPPLLNQLLLKLKVPLQAIQTLLRVKKWKFNTLTIQIHPTNLSDSLFHLRVSTEILNHIVRICLLYNTIKSFFTIYFLYKIICKHQYIILFKIAFHH